MSNNQKTKTTPTTTHSSAPRFGGGPKNIQLNQNNQKSIKSPEKIKDEEIMEEEKDEVHDQNKESFDNYESKYGPKQKKHDKKKSLDCLFDKQTKEQEKSIIDKPYHQDGDPSMYTKESLELRNALKEDPDVKKAIYKKINNFYLQNSQFMNLYTWDKDGKLQIDGYLFVHTGLAELLRDDLSEDVKGDELKFILEQDWQHDSRGKEYMSKDDLYDSLFELVDIWCPDIDKDEYIDFFQYISSALSKKGNTVILYMLYNYIKYFFQGYNNPYSIL